MDKLSYVLSEYCNGLNEILGESLKQVILYGSVSRNENTDESDIDIMLLVDLSSEDIKNIYEEICDYTYEIDLKYDVLISPVIENIDLYNERVQYIPFYKNVNKEGVILKNG